MSLGRFMRETKFKKENERMQKLANTIARTDDLIDELSDHMIKMEVKKLFESFSAISIPKDPGQN